MAVDLLDEQLERFRTHVLLVPEDVASELAKHLAQRELVRERACRVEVGLAERLRDRCAGDPGDRSDQEPLACCQERIGIVVLQPSLAAVGDEVARENLLELVATVLLLDLGDVGGGRLVSDALVRLRSR